MSTGFAYSEDYADPNADPWKYSAAARPFSKPSDYKGPDGCLEYLQMMDAMLRRMEACMICLA